MSGNIRHLILSNFLSIFRRHTPFIFWTNAQFYGKYEGEIKEILDDPKSAVILMDERGYIKNYACPFRPDGYDRLQGWIIVKNPNRIISYYVFPEYRGFGVGDKLVEEAYSFLKEPPQVILTYPTKMHYETICGVLSKTDIKVLPVINDIYR